MYENSSAGGTENLLSQVGGIVRRPTPKRRRRRNEPPTLRTSVPISPSILPMTMILGLKKRLPQISAVLLGDDEKNHDYQYPGGYRQLNQ